MGPFIQPLIEYLKGQPFNNVLIAGLLGVIVYFNIERAQQAKEAHAMVHSVFSDLREENRKNQNRLIFAIKGIRYDDKADEAKAMEAAEADSGGPGL